MLPIFAVTACQTKESKQLSNAVYKGEKLNKNIFSDYFVLKNPKDIETINNTWNRYDSRDIESKLNELLEKEFPSLVRDYKAFNDYDTYGTNKLSLELYKMIHSNFDTYKLLAENGCYLPFKVLLSLKSIYVSDRKNDSKYSLGRRINELESAKMKEINFSSTFYPSVQINTEQVKLIRSLGRIPEHITTINYSWSKFFANLQEELEDLSIVDLVKMSYMIITINSLFNIRTVSWSEDELPRPLPYYNSYKEEEEKVKERGQKYQYNIDVEVIALAKAFLGASIPEIKVSGLPYHSTNGDYLNAKLMDEVKINIEQNKIKLDEYSSELGAKIHTFANSKAIPNSLSKILIVNDNWSNFLEDEVTAINALFKDSTQKPDVYLFTNDQGSDNYLDIPFILNLVNKNNIKTLILSPKDYSKFKNFMDEDNKSQLRKDLIKANLNVICYPNETTSSSYHSYNSDHYSGSRYANNDRHLKFANLYKLDLDLNTEMINAEIAKVIGQFITKVNKIQKDSKNQISTVWFKTKSHDSSRIGKYLDLIQAHTTTKLSYKIANNTTNINEKYNYAEIDSSLDPYRIIIDLDDVEYSYPSYNGNWNFDYNHDPVREKPKYVNDFDISKISNGLMFKYYYSIEQNEQDHNSYNLGFEFNRVQGLYDVLANIAWKVGQNSFEINDENIYHASFRNSVFRLNTQNFKDLVHARNHFNNIILENSDK
ncbi:hypothetical protein [Mycoplasma seminis]|uniref:Lipoprotein n=1 Tax=Mycoplasma seminis TaxID=512749 RepID=A0ABY9HBL3_9MOLU|nr:hypothetical protein [Mycoplasma seminis]WLP85738.1 hypothetical protein Q8852_01110 [Mycoplasma seminis]